MDALPQSTNYSVTRRDDVRPSIPRTARSVLDVGCGLGGFGNTLREVLGPDARLVGVEATPESAAKARATGSFDEIVQGYFPAALDDRDERFDLVCFNDVLEHVLDPWGLLERVHQVLTPGGQVLAAIPNIQYFEQQVRTFRGRWDYADSGLLDRTHVRFFTRATMLEMFEGAGYEVQECRGANSWFNADHEPQSLKGHVRRWTAIERMLGDASYLHFVVLARPTPGSSLDT